MERVASELVSRLPALRPDRYRVVAPRPALAHRAGHVWEQARASAHRSRRRPDPLARQHGAAGEPAQRRLRPRPGSAARAGVVRTRLRRLAPDRTTPNRGERAAAAGAIRVRLAGAPGTARRRTGSHPRRAARGSAATSRPRPGLAPPRSTRPTCWPSERRARARTSSCSTGWRPGSAKPAWRSSSQEQAAPTCRSRLRAPGGSATSKSGTSRRSTRTRRSWRCPRSTRASGCRASRRWHAARRSWRRTAPRYPRRAAARRCWSTRTTPDAFAAALIGAAGPERERLTEAGRARAAGLSWARSAESVDAAIGALL